MKNPKSFKIIFFLVIIIFTGLGCESSDSDFLIAEIGDTGCIEDASKNIDFKFCLLDQEGKPSTVFNNGENFSFSFSFKNKMQNNIIVTPEFITSDFYRVYRLDNNKDMGKPWTGTWCNFSLQAREFELAFEQTIKLTCPWILTDNSQPDYPLCMSESKEFLPKGEYYTQIKLNFQMEVNGKKKVIDNLKFRINFKIK